LCAMSFLYSAYIQKAPKKYIMRAFRFRNA
jgi:hypothetical protein